MVGALSRACVLILISGDNFIRILAGFSADDICFTLLYFLVYGDGYDGYEYPSTFKVLIDFPLSSLMHIAELLLLYKLVEDIVCIL